MAVGQMHEQLRRRPLRTINKHSRGRPVRQLAYDGRTLSAWNSNALRAKLGIVKQDTRLFSGTICTSLPLEAKASRTCNVRAIVEARRWAVVDIVAGDGADPRIDDVSPRPQAGGHVATTRRVTQPVGA